MLVNQLQERLAGLYETPVAHAIADFLVTDPRLAQALCEEDEADANEERLLVRESGDTLDVTLYIDARVLAHLSERDPFARLDGENLNDFLIALEGVSHFNYLVWNAMHARPVTQLELELQAEVDKFVTVSGLLRVQGAGAKHEALLERLFSAVRFLDQDDHASAKRYRDANRYAARFCRALARRHPAQQGQPAFLNELRRFYRLSQNDKIRTIERMAH